VKSEARDHEGENKARGRRQSRASVQRIRKDFY
jgi:hypothetical protein